MGGAFGVIEEDTNPALYMPIGFAGGLHDRDVGFVRFGYRDYDPKTSRFTAKDPLGYAAGEDDLYGYCFDDPVNGIDPLGLDTEGVDGSASISGLGGRLDVGVGLHWDENGGWGIVPHFDYGASTGRGIAAGGSHQETGADSVDDLAGEATVAGGGISVPTPTPVSVGAGAEKIIADGYEGSTRYLEGSVGGFLPIEGHITKQNSIVWHPFGWGKKE